MNLTEVIVAASVFLGACSGAAQMSAASAAAISQSRLRAAALEQIEVQFLAAAPVIHSGLGPSTDCAAAARAMLQQLEASLPPLKPGLQRQLSLSASSEQVLLRFNTGSGVQRARLLAPAAFGLCGGPAPQEAGDATV